MHSHPNVDCYFYKGNPKLDTEYKLEGDILWIRIKESLDTVYEKTLKAFEYFADQMSNYQYVFRPNISSFVRFDKYIEYCSTLPKQRLVSACVAVYDNFEFPAGAGFTMSTDVVLELVKDKPPSVFVDDVSIGKWLNTKGIPIQPATRCDYTFDNGIPTYHHRDKTTLFHYRIKNLDRKIDIVIHRILLNQFYGK
jgi:hypothetical protein